MHYAPAVSGRECVKELEREIEQLGQRQRTRLQALREREPLQKLHHDERSALVQAGVVDCAYVRVVQRRRCACLPPESLEIRVVVDDFVAQELERHSAAEAYVVCRIDDAHPAFAQALSQAIVRHDAPTHRRGPAAFGSQRRGPAESRHRISSGLSGVLNSTHPEASPSGRLA